MDWILTFTILLVLIATGFTDCGYKSDKSEYTNSWKPVKPAKVTPKYDDTYNYNAGEKPNGVPLYGQGIYTSPYYAYGEIKPVYQPLYKPYPSYNNGNYYTKKEDKDKLYVAYFKN